VKEKVELDSNVGKCAGLKEKLLRRGPGKSFARLVPRRRGVSVYGGSEITQKFTNRGGLRRFCMGGGVKSRPLIIMMCGITGPVNLAITNTGIVGGEGGGRLSTPGNAMDPGGAFRGRKQVDQQCSVIRVDEDLREE